MKNFTLLILFLSVLFMSSSAQTKKELKNFQKLELEVIAYDVEEYSSNINDPDDLKKMYRDVFFSFTPVVQKVFQNVISNSNARPKFEQKWREMFFRKGITTNSYFSRKEGGFDFGGSRYILLWENYNTISIKDVTEGLKQVGLIKVHGKDKFKSHWSVNDYVMNYIIDEIVSQSFKGLSPR